MLLLLGLEIVSHSWFLETSSNLRRFSDGCREYPHCREWLGVALDITLCGSYGTRLDRRS